MCALCQVEGGEVGVFPGHEQLYMFMIQLGLMLCACIVAVLCLHRSLPALKDYMTLPDTQHWLQEHNGFDRVLFASLRAVWPLAVLGTALIAFNATATSVYSSCEDPLVNLSISFNQMTNVYEWVFAFVAVASQVHDRSIG